jgi:flagellar biosynthesis protein FliR
MISVSAEFILQQLAQYALPFARMSGLLMTMSVIGSRNFPARFRLLRA